MAGQKNIVAEKLDEVTRLLQYLVAIELSRENIPKAAIGKHLHVATGTVGKILKGIKKDKGNG